MFASRLAHLQHVGLRFCQSLSGPCVVRAGIMLLVLGATLAASARPAAANHRFNIHFTELLCDEETDGVGSDEIFVVFFSADLHTQATETLTVRSKHFNDVDSGEDPAQDPSLRVWGLNGGSRAIPDRDHIVILAAVLEQDGGGPQARDVMRDTVKANLNGNLPQYMIDFRAGRLTAAQVRDRLIADMNSAINLASAASGEDRIGSTKDVRPPADTLRDAQNGGVETYDSAMFEGYGARYRLRFQVTAPAH